MLKNSNSLTVYEVKKMRAMPPGAVLVKGIIHGFTDAIVSY